MFRLTREVRFSINPSIETHPAGAANGFAGFPSMQGLGRYFMLQVTIAGPLQPDSSYLLNIKDIDLSVRNRVVPYLREVLASSPDFRAESAALAIYERLRDTWSGAALEGIRLSLTPFFCVAVQARESPMVRLSQKFEFSASHRLHNPDLSEEDNRSLFGKCNNPHGHGHNYEVQVTVLGTPDDNGMLIELPVLERIVSSNVIDRFDHRNLNLEIPEFRHLNPTVENIAQTIYELLKPGFRDERVRLASVTVWETPKTWCEYSEGGASVA